MMALINSQNERQSLLVCNMITHYTGMTYYE